MASNSPGTHFRSAGHTESPDLPMVGGPSLAELSYPPGKFQLQVTGSLQRDPSLTLTVRDSGYMSTSDGASTCSSSTAELCDLEGGTLLLLEAKSLRSFITNDEYLYAMKEDLADWFSSLYQNADITADNFFHVLETGILLCKHANKVQEVARLRREMGEALEMKSYFIKSVPESHIPYREGVKPETFQARDNISNFISWTRRLGIPEILSFETDDLVLRKNEKSVILCLLEVARVGAKLGMLAPTLVQMEEEIDAELAGEEPQPRAQIKTCDLRSLDERVRDLVSRCTCPVQFPMIKVSEGKYKIGDTKSLIFVRILRNHVMVRVGGGWDTLENYLNKHDPCQCNYRGHRAGSAGVAHKVSQGRRSSITNNNLLQTPSLPASQKVVSTVANTSRNRSASPQNPSSRTNSPNIIVSRNIATPLKHGANQTSSSKVGHWTPGENHQELTAEVWPSQPTRSSDIIRSNSPNQAAKPSNIIKSSSPTPGRVKSPSPLTILQNTTPVFPSSKPPTSGLMRRRDTHQESKPIKQQKISIPSVNSKVEDDVKLGSNYSVAEEVENDQPNHPDNISTTRFASAISGQGQLPSVPQMSNPQGPFDLMTNIASDEKHSLGRSTALDFLSNQRQVEITLQKSNLLTKHMKTVDQHPSSVLVRNSEKKRRLSGHEMIPSNLLAKLADVKSASDSGDEGIRKRRTSLPQVSATTFGFSSGVAANKQKDQKASKNNEDKVKDLHRTAMSSPHFVQKESLEPRNSSRVDIATTFVKGSRDMEKDAILQIDTASIECPPLTNKKNMAGISSNTLKSPSQMKLVDSDANTLTNIVPAYSNSVTPTHNATVRADKLISPQSDNIASTTKERPVSRSRIPKPCFTPRTSPSRSPVVIPSSKHSTKDYSSSEISSPQNENINTASINILPVTSKSNSSLSSIQSPDDIKISPDDICRQSSQLVKSTVHSTQVSDSLDHINTKSQDHKSKRHFSIKDIETSDKNSRQVIDQNENNPENNRKPPAFEHRNIPNSSQKNIAGLKPQLASPKTCRKHSPTNTTVPETPEEMMIVNDITFSDDEEVNELIKNLALQKRKENNKNPSKGLAMEKYSPQKSKKSEEVLMVSRNSSGYHTVQHEQKYHTAAKSKSTDGSHPNAQYKDILPYEKPHPTLKNTNTVLLENKINSSAKSEELPGNNSVVSASLLDDISFSRTEAWVDSTLPGNTRKS